MTNTLRCMILAPCNILFMLYLFTLHVSHILRDHPLAVISLHIARTLQNTFSAVSPHVARTFQNPAFAVCTIASRAYGSVSGSKDW